MLSGKKILICPLDWGLGHATRCIPIIRYLLERGAEVSIGTSGRALELLRKEFSDLEYPDLGNYGITYPKNGSMAFSMFLQIPKILAGIMKEHVLLKEFISRKHIDLIISDNRYGIWSKEIPSIFITHQLNIQMPILLFPFGFLLKGINRRFTKAFKYCWVPDFENVPRLAGALSQGVAGNLRYIGPLSRMGRNSRHSHEAERYEITAILSGPEPQRTLLEKILTKQLLDCGRKSLMVLGKTENFADRQVKNLRILNYLESEDLEKTILNSDIIIARSGYSTIMDLWRLKAKAIFIPTPGQTEQEYLARYYKRLGIFYSESQSYFNLERALSETSRYRGWEAFPSSGEDFLKKLPLLLAEAI